MQENKDTPKHVSTVPVPVVAVVDDDAAVCSSLKFALELEGFRVRVYSGAAELLRDGELDAFQCFVIDQKMPAMAGFDLIRRLREQKISTPAILIVSQPNAVLSARAAKANVPIVEKPFLNDALVDLIREACSGAP